MNMQEASKFRALNRMVGEGVLRDLAPLKTIDETIEALREVKAAADYSTEIVSREAGRVKEVSGPIDTDAVLVPMLEKTRDGLGEMHAALKERCAFARSAPELTPDDGVVESYCQSIDAVAALHNAVNGLCWAIGEHDADFDEKLPGSYSNADDLFAAMGV